MESFGCMSRSVLYCNLGNCIEQEISVLHDLLVLLFARLGLRQADLSVQVKVTMKSSYNIEIEE